MRVAFGIMAFYILIDTWHPIAAIAAAAAILAEIIIDHIRIEVEP